MQRLLDAAVRGSYWYTSGTIPLHKAARFANKLAERYGVNSNRNQRAYARRIGRANARLFFLKLEGYTDLRWWLLATDGRGAVHEQETLLDLRDKRSRLRIDDDYELVRVTRPRATGGGTVWTWRFTRSCYRRWQIRLLDACRKADSRELRLALGSLRRVPGFSGTRRQIGRLISAARREWRRRHGPSRDFPEISKLGYVERLRDVVVPLSACMKEEALVSRAASRMIDGY